MNRRAAAGTSPLLVLRLAALAVVLTALVTVLVAETTAAGGDEPSPEPPPTTTINDFLPEEQNLTDCIGTVERPGCGSESRGGWRQTLTFTAMAAGLVVVFGRLAWAVRRNSRARADSG